MSNTLDKDAITWGQKQYHIALCPEDIGEYVLLPGDPARSDIAAKYLENRTDYLAHMSKLRERTVELLSAEDGFHLLSPTEDYAPHILNVSFDGMRGEVLLHLLEREGIAVSTGSACSSKKSRDFRIHEHLGLSRDRKSVV